MQVTLRRAARLLSQIDAKISELSSKLYGTSSKSVFVGDNTADITRRLVDVRADGTELLTRVLALIDARTTLRGLVGRANADNGVNDLVTTLKGTDLKLQTVRQLRMRAGTEPALSDRELIVRLTALWDQSPARQAQVSIRSYRSGSEDDNTATFNTFHQTDLDQFAATEKDLLKKLEATQEQIERVNNTITFEVPAETVDALKAADVL